MTIQEAYNKGLDDAENLAYLKLKKALSKIEDSPFGNPKMEELRQEILNFTVPENVEQVSGDTCIPLDDSVINIIESIILQKKYISVPLEDRKYKVVKVFEELMNHFVTLSKNRTNVGKAFSKLLKEQQNALTSDKPVVN